MNGDEMQEVDKFNYIGVVISRNDGMGGGNDSYGA